MGFQDMKGLFPGGWTVAAKSCDSCKSSAAAIFCRPDSAFLCLSCDAKLHCGSRHERVWMCEVCEQAPAAVTCKADAAALCVTCDADIHSANPLASRHERVPVEPFYDSAESIVNKCSAAAASINFFDNAGGNNVSDDLDAANWMIPTSGLDSKLLETNHMKNGDLFFPEMDPYLDFEFPSSVDKFQNHVTDSVVPAPANPIPAPPIITHNSENCFEIDFGKSKISPFSFPAQSISQSVSSSEVGVVPDGNSMSDISYSFGRNMNGVPESSVSVSASNNQVNVIDREARVLRYREKRKNRKFQKTIRYASRKAYAETRPRIKGRFAKRTEMGAEMEQIYGSGSPVFGVVPTF